MRVSYDVGQPSASPGFEPKSMHTGIRKRILIIEDDDIVRECMTMLLQPEYEVLTAGNGFEGIDIAQTHAPDLVVSDLNMDGLDGLQVAQALRQTRGTSRIPFVLVTATAEAELQNQCRIFGVNQLVRKPFDPEMLMGTVKRLLAGPA